MPSGELSGDRGGVYLTFTQRVNLDAVRITDNSADGNGGGIYVDYDGPAEALAEAMSRASGLRVKKLGASPGSLGSYAGVELKIPIVTLELPKRVSKWDKAALWKVYGPAMIEAVRLTGVE